MRYDAIVRDTASDHGEGVIIRKFTRKKHNPKRAKGQSFFGFDDILINHHACRINIEWRDARGNTTSSFELFFISKP